MPKTGKKSVPRSQGPVPKVAPISGAKQPAVVWLSLDDVRKLEDPQNSKKHDINGIVASIQRFGFVAPPIVDGRTGRLAAGHGRAEALDKIRSSPKSTVPKGVRVRGSVWELPVLVGTFESVDDDHAAAYLIADNKLTIAGGFDDELTSKVLKGLSPALQLATGYSAAEIERITRQFDPQSTQPRLDIFKTYQVTCPKCSHEFEYKPKG
jgi:hypothetical protein